MGVTVEIELSFEDYALLRSVAKSEGRSVESLAADLLADMIRRQHAWKETAGHAGVAPEPPPLTMVEIANQLEESINYVCENDSSRLELRVLDVGEPLVIAVRGAVDAYTAPEVRSRLHAALDDFERRTLVLEMSECQYLDSRGLGVFVGLVKAARERGGMLIFAALSERILRLLEVTQLDRTFHITATVEEAVEKARQHAQGDGE
jgi:anti-sigma B factor antagonist